MTFYSLTTLTLGMTFSRADNSRLQLTPEEILEISRDISSNFAPVLDAPGNERLNAGKSRRCTAESTPYSPDAIIYSSPISGSTLSARDLLEISSSVSQQYAPKAAAITPELLILPVDPYHLYACWDMGDCLRTKYTAKEHSNSLVLRIYWWPGEAARQHPESNVWLDIPVDQLQQCRQIRLPLADSVYSAAMGELLPDYHFDALAYSNQIRVPAIGKKEAPQVVKNDKNLWELYELTLPQGGISQFPAENWQINLHATAADNNAARMRSFKLSELFSRMDLTVQLIPEFDIIEVSSCFNLRASGQGIIEKTNG